MTEKYVPKVGDIVRRIFGTPDEVGYTEQILEVIADSTTPYGWSNITKQDLEFILGSSSWTVELVHRPEPPLPTEEGSMGWVDIGASRYFVVRDCDTVTPWDMYMSDADPGERAEDEDLSNFRQARAVPADLMEKAEEWAKHHIILDSSDEVAVSILKKIVDQTHEEEEKLH